MPRRKATTPPAPTAEKGKARKTTRQKAVKANAEKPAEPAAVDGFSIGLNMLFGGRLEAAKNAGKNQKAAQGEPQEAAKPKKARRTKAEAMPQAAEAAAAEQQKKRGGRKKSEVSDTEVKAGQPKKRGGRKKAEAAVVEVKATPQQKKPRKAKLEIAPAANTPVDLKDIAYINSAVEQLKIALSTQLVDIKFIFKRARIVIGLESKEELERIVKLINESHEKDVAKKTDLLRSASRRFSK